MSTKGGIWTFNGTIGPIFNLFYLSPSNVKKNSVIIIFLIIPPILYCSLPETNLLR